MSQTAAGGSPRVLAAGGVVVLTAAGAEDDDDGVAPESNKMSRATKEAMRSDFEFPIGAIVLRQVLAERNFLMSEAVSQLNMEA